MFERELPNLLKALKEPPIFGPRTGQPECVRVCSQDVRGPECLYSSAAEQKARKLGMHSFPSLLSYQGCFCPPPFDSCPGSEARVGLVVKLQESFQGRLPAWPFRLLGLLLYRSVRCYAHNFPA